MYFYRAVDCSFAVHVPEGLQIYSSNGARHRQYAFHRVPFRVGDAFVLPLFASFSCNVNPDDNDKVSCIDAARPFNVVL